MGATGPRECPDPPCPSVAYRHSPASQVFDEWSPPSSPVYADPAVGGAHSAGDAPLAAAAPSSPLPLGADGGAAERDQAEPGDAERRVKRPRSPTQTDDDKEVDERRASNHAADLKRVYCAIHDALDNMTLSKLRDHLNAARLAHAPALELNAMVPTCPVCLDDIHPMRRLACRHEVCRPCIRAWLRRQRTCPLCRAAVDTRDYRRLVGIASNPGPAGGLDAPEAEPSQRPRREGVSRVDYTDEADRPVPSEWHYELSASEQKLRGAQCAIVAIVRERRIEIEAVSLVDTEEQVGAARAQPRLV